MAEPTKIAVLTSGGDAQGMNAVVRAVNVPVTLKTRLGWDDAPQPRKGR